MLLHIIILKWEAKLRDNCSHFVSDRKCFRQLCVWELACTGAHSYHHTHTCNNCKFNKPGQTYNYSFKLGWKTGTAFLKVWPLSPRSSFCPRRSFTVTFQPNCNSNILLLVHYKWAGTGEGNSSLRHKLGEKGGSKILVATAASQEMPLVKASVLGL